MRNKERIRPLLERLEAVWKEHPDLRLGQLILNVVKDPALYYLEDEEIVSSIEEFYSTIDSASK